MGKRNLKNKSRINLLDVYKALRKLWTINPASKIKGSDTIYNRKREKLKFIKEIKDG